MSEKRKNMTLDELKAFVSQKVEADTEQQVENSWKLHNAIMKKLAEGKVEVHPDKTISVRLRFWNGAIADYDHEALKGMLSANGLWFAEIYHNSWQGYNFPLPGCRFEFRLQFSPLVVETPDSEAS